MGGGVLLKEVIAGTKAEQWKIGNFMLLEAKGEAEDQLVVK